MKALIRYKHGTPPHSVMTGTTEELIAEMSNKFEVMEHNGFYFDKKNPRKSPPLRKMFRAPHPPHDYFVIIDADKWQDKLDKTLLPVTEVEADGNRRWGGGAWVIAFVYSNRGNFVVKGYHDEVKDHLEDQRRNGMKFFVNYSMWDGGAHRDWWSTSDSHIRISSPDKSNRFRWVVTKRGEGWNTLAELKFRRMPKRWIPEIDELTR